MSGQPLPRIAILGGGPIGLEAALYARKLGYAVRVYERGRVGDNLRKFAHVRLFSPFGMNVSPQALETLLGEKRGYRAPPDDQMLTAGQFVDVFLEPLARSPALAGSICEGTTVVAVGRSGLLKGDLIGKRERAATPFRLLLRETAGREWSAEADVVLDVTGVFGNANWLGSGGIPAEGEMLAEAWIDRGLPDVLGRERDQYRGKTTLVVGTGYSAATNAIALAELAKRSPGTRVVWFTRGVWPTRSASRSALAEREPHTPDPIPRIENDRLPERDRVACRANELVRNGAVVEHHARLDVTRLQRDDGRLRVTAKDADGKGDAREFIVDRILANCGYRPDNSIYQELQVHECYVSGGPMKLAAALLGQVSTDCLDQVSLGPETLRTPEPNFFILGAKSYGRNSKFLLSIGLEQVRDVFQLISGDIPQDLSATGATRTDGATI